MPDRVRLIVNPSAGGGHAAKVLPEVESALRELGLEVLTCATTHLEHATELADAAAAAGEISVTLGGDGLVGAVAAGLRRHPASVLGVLPGGRGNDLARVLGIPSDLRAACRVIVEGRQVALDVGDVGGRTFVGIASAGFDSDANRIANEAPPRLGNLVYAYGALRALAAWKPARFEIELDPPGEVHRFTGFSIAAANSRAYGGGMFLAPEARLDDGQLDIVVSERVSKARFLANLPRVFKGTHVELPECHVFRARTVRISADRPFALYADGDPIGDLPAVVQAVPGALQVLLPATGSNEAFSSGGSG